MHFELTGNMNHYLWAIDNRTLSETDRILIRKGENVRIILYIGFQYTLPMLLVLDMRIDTNGQLRSQLMHEDIPLTPRLRLDLMGNIDLEYMAGLRYVLDKMWTIRAHYDSDMGLGVGLMVTY
jgi:hypothetical protein